MLLLLPLNTISVEAPFQQWGEINPSYFGQHKWILIATDYFKNGLKLYPPGDPLIQLYLILLIIIFSLDLDFLDG